MAILDSAFRELRYATRVMTRTPALSITIVLVLAVGIGGGSAVYAMVRGVIWPDLRVREPERLVALHHRHLEQDYYSSFALPQLRDLAAGLDTLTAVTGFVEGVPVNLGGDGGPVERVEAAVVGSEYFPTLGIEAAAGRLLGPADADEDVAVLSHGLWVERFGARPDAVGAAVRVNGRPFRIVGVAAAGFVGVEHGSSARLWIPRGRWHGVLPWLTEEMLGSRTSHWLSVVGRLAPGADLETARAEITGLAGGLAAAYPETDADWDVVVQPYAQGRLYPGLQDDVYGTLALLATVVALVLVLICANVANLLLARNRGRAAEMAVRRALGARRGDLARQSILESMVLALAGGGAGLLLAAWAVDLLGGVRAALGSPIMLEGRLDGGVIAFTLLLCIITGATFGLPAAWPASRAAAPGRSDASPRAGTGRGGILDLRDVLAAAQIALCLALLVGSVLLQRSLWNLQATEPGFEPRGVVLGAVDLGLSGYRADDGLRLLRRLQEQLAAHPEVQGASFAVTVPLDRRRFASDVAVSGRRLESAGNLVGPGYLGAMRMRLLRGRDFDHGDTVEASPVAIVNESLARDLWPGSAALGRSLDVFVDGPEPVGVAVVGVVADGIYGRDIDARGRPFFLLPALQHYRPTMVIHARGHDGTGAGIAAAMRTTLARLDPAVPLYDVRTLEQHVDEFLSRPRAVALHASLFGALALALSAIGIYGVVSYRVGERVAEIGLRLAVGARSRDISGMVLRWAGGLAAAGITGGLLTALLLRGTYASLLYGVEPLDTPTFAGCAAFLAAVAVVAAWLPARRAARVDPARSLRGR